MKTKGATSYVTLTIEELNSLIKPNGKIEVRRRFVENLRKANAVSVEKVESSKGVEATTEEDTSARIQIKIKNWD